MPLPALDVPRVEKFSQEAAARATGDVLLVLGLAPPKMVAIMRAALPPDRGLVFIEPTLDFAIRMLCQHDFSDAVAGGLTAIVFAGDDRQLQAQLEAIVAKWGVTELQLVMNPIRYLGDRVANAVGELVRAALRGVELATSTGARYGQDTLANISGNLRAACGGQDLVSLAGAWRDVPAFVIGAGPSLAENGEQLLRLRDRGLVIACDAALPILMERGVYPDIVVSLDVVDTKAVLFERDFVKNGLLVALLGAHPKLVSSWIGPIGFAVDDHPLAQWAAKCLPGAVEVGPLGNVAQLGFTFARLLGCDPIVLCGVDMAIGDGGEMYAPGVAHRAARSVGELPAEVGATVIELPANVGGPVRTLKNMAVYGETLSKIAALPGRTYTTARRGLKMTGIDYAPMEPLLDTIESRSVRRPVAGTQPSPADIDVARQIMAEELGLLEGELRSYAADASQFADATDEAAEMLSVPGMDEEGVVRALQPHLESFGRHRGVIDMVEALQPAVVYEVNRLVRKTKNMPDPVERARTRLLALGGPAANGAQIAEAMSDKLHAARLQLRQPRSVRLPRAPDPL